MKISPETLTALKESISHWEVMANSGLDKEKPRADECSLCKLFLDDDCKGCPIADYTGKSHSYDTPYHSAFGCYLDGDRTTFKLHAEAEVEFLTIILAKIEVQS